MKWPTGIVAALLACAPLNEAASWGASGHSIVAEIAQRRLEPDALRRIKELLGGEVSLASIASWADNVALLRPNTYNWHFVNIPYDATGYDAHRDCRQTPKGDCVIAAIARARDALAAASGSRQERIEALMFLVHFVGDIHQPLHCADRNDAGGSQLPVTFFGEPTTLHMVWDVGIIERRSFDWGEQVALIEQGWFPGQDVAALQRGEPADWAWEAHVVAVEVAYALPENHELGVEYFRRSLSVVDRQLALAGIRLARLLNEAFAQ